MKLIPECRTPTRLAVDPDVPAALPNGAEDSGEAEAGPLFTRRAYNPPSRANCLQQVIDSERLPQPLE